MNFVAQGITVSDILQQFAETLTIWHMMGMVVLLGLSGVFLLRQKPDWPLLLMFGCSLLTATGSQGVSKAAFLGRWYFLALCAVIAVMRLGRTLLPIVVLTGAWAAVNLLGLMYTPSFEKGLVRGAYFVLVIPALIFSMTPPFADVDAIIRLLRRFAVVGAALALVHLIFVLVAPQGLGTSRFKSFFESGQVMSLATATATLPMVWALLSKNAGKWGPIFLGGTFINLLVLIASTQRTAIFSLAGAVVITLYFYRSRGVIVALVTGLGIALIAWPIITFLVDESFLIQRLSNVESAGRSVYWEWGIQEGLKSPILGYGSGAGTHEMSIRFRHKFHQAYIAVFYDFGFVGLMIFLSMLGFGMAAALRVARRKHEPRIRAVGVFVLANLAMVAAQGLVETGLADTANQTAMMFYLGLGLAGAVSQMREEDALELPLLAQDVRGGYRPPPVGLRSRHEGYAAR
jgi:hypothetical protein